VSDSRNRVQQGSADPTEHSGIGGDAERQGKNDDGSKAWILPRHAAINNGSNRWAFKPEFGYSERWGHWLLDAYGGAWFFTTNSEFWSHNEFFPGTRTQSEAPVGSFEGHVSYNFKPRLWVSLDGNFWFGGRITINGIENVNTYQKNSRIGVTASIPVTKHQSLKFS
jgi:hypothetical protein